MNDLSIEEIMESIPHRYPFLLIDKVVKCIPNKELIALKNVSGNEYFFQGHFPNKPIMPGVLILESMAQATGVLISYSENNKEKGGLYYLLGIEKARFKRNVIPGDQLKLEISMERKIKDIYKFGAKAIVDNAEVASAEILTTGKKE